LADLVYGNVTTTSFDVFLESLDTTHPNYYSIQWYKDGTYVGKDEPVVSSSEWHFSGLSPDTCYTIRAEIWDAETHEFLDYEFKSFCTEAQTLATPTLDTSATVKTTSSIEVTVNPVTGADYYHARIDGGAWVTQTSRTFTFSGLDSFTQYYIEIYVSGSGYDDSSIAGYYATTILESWNWWSTVSSGSSFNIGVAEWAAFLDKINEIRVYNGYANYTFGNFNGDSPSSGDPFKALYYNEAVLAINELGYSYLTKSPGDEVSAERFISLKDAINAKI
jgi:hypothetical protein